jgi:hypothetical protein
MNKIIQIRIAVAAAALLAAASALAGPPLICQEFEIGGARSLPWKDGSGWRGEAPAYKLSGLTEDTLTLLAPSTPILVRMETMRRAAIYAATDTAAADTLTARLMARTLDAEAKRQSDALAWFDAGYFVESLRQATFVYRYDMLTSAERDAWKLRGSKPGLDGHGWVKRAIKLGGQDMHFALSLIEEYRNADLKHRAPVVVSARD